MGQLRKNNFDVYSKLNWEMFCHFELAMKNNIVANSSHRFTTNLQNQISERKNDHNFECFFIANKSNFVYIIIAQNKHSRIKRPRFFQPP